LEIGVESGDDAFDAIFVDELHESESEFSELAGNRYSCAAHNLQLCMGHAIKSTLARSDPFKKLLKFLNSFAHSANARSALKRLGKLYKKFVKTRWGCWPDVVERYFQIKDNMVQVI